MRSASPDPNRGSAERPTPPRACGACQGRDLTLITEMPIYIRNGSVPDTIWRCTNCHSYQRAISFCEIVKLGHFDVASYTNPGAEERLRRSRHGFFELLVRILRRSYDTSLSGKSILDIGCSYGHLLDLLRTHGARTTGLEIVDYLRGQITEHGHAALDTLPDASAGYRFDMITMIDSLYLIDHPLQYLIRLRKLIADDGRLLLRITNRTPLFDLFRFLGKPITDAYAGDCKHHFSYRGIIRLLTDAGFGIERIVLWERGKRHPGWTGRLYYSLTPALSRMTGCKLSPGMIILARLS